MPKFRYGGSDGRPDDDGEWLRPGEVREMDEAPEWGPWTECDADGNPPGDEGAPELSQDATAALAPAPGPAPASKSAKTATPPAAGNESEGA